MYKRILTIILVYIPAGFVVASVLLVTLLKWVPVTITPLMVRRSIESIGKPHHTWSSAALKASGDHIVRSSAHGFLSRAFPTI